MWLFRSSHCYALIHTAVVVQTVGSMMRCYQWLAAWSRVADYVCGFTGVTCDSGFQRFFFKAEIDLTKNKIGKNWSVYKNSRFVPYQFGIIFNTLHFVSSPRIAFIFESLVFEMFHFSIVFGNLQSYRFVSVLFSITQVQFRRNFGLIFGITNLLSLRFAPRTSVMVSPRYRNSPTPILDSSLYCFINATPAILPGKCTVLATNSLNIAFLCLRWRHNRIIVT